MLAVAGSLQFLALGDNARNKVFEFAGALELTKVLRIGRGNVDGDVVRSIVDLVEALLVVGKRILDRRHGILADIDAEDAAAQAEGIRGTKVLQNLVHAFIIEAHAVDDAARRNQAEKTGLGIARLSKRRDRADLNVAEAEAAEGGNAFAVLIHAGREANRIRETQSHHFNGIIIGHVRHEIRETELDRPVEVRHDDVMSRLGVHRKENAPGNVVEHDFRLKVSVRKLQLPPEGQKQGKSTNYNDLVFLLSEGCMFVMTCGRSVKLQIHSPQSVHIESTIIFLQLLTNWNLVCIISIYASEADRIYRGVEQSGSSSGS